MSETSAPPSAEEPARARGMATTLRRVRLALGLVAFGLVVQLVTTLFWSPLMFVLFAVVGVSAVGLGAALFLYTIWRRIDRADDEEGS